MVSKVAFASTRYSTSVKDCATTLCFFELQDIKVDPRKQMHVEMKF